MISVFSKNSTLDLAVVCIVKDEFDYLLEWIAYHRKVIGVKHFYIADNVSNDGTTQLLEALGIAGLITRVHFPRIDDTQGIQASAYNYILKKYCSKHEYMAFIDADEFIVNKTGQPLHSILDKLNEESDFGALALNWRVFGSSGFYYQTKDFVIDRFRLASRVDHPVNHHIKSIVKANASSEMHIHHMSLKKGYRYFARNGACEFIRDLKKRTPANSGEITPFKKELDEELYVAHFVVKSKFEHMSKKAKRGSAAGAAARQKGEAYFNYHNLNQVWNEDLSHYLELVEKEVNFLKQVLKEKTYFGRAIRFNVDRFDSTIAGWIGIEKSKPAKIKVLVGGVDETQYVLNVERRDVFDLGLTDELKCGFSINLSEYDKSQLVIWLEGSNTVLWHGTNAF